MRALTGVVQHYGWGSLDELPRLLDATPDGRPWAEWWLGTHSGGVARVDDGTPLDALVDPLPYLVKVIAAAEPLSLQTHPDAAQARAGFEREEAAGPARDDPRRTYTDPHAKPELLVALGEFDALVGFRTPADIAADAREIGLEALAQRVERDGVEATLRAMYAGAIDLDHVLEACRGVVTSTAQLVSSLAARWPGDPSTAAALLLNHVTLAPGEAVFLPAGNLHAYLHGVGLEVMGPSDNVIRAGMTTKHVDVTALLDTVVTEELLEPRAATHRVDGEVHYDTPGAPFVVRRVEVATAYRARAAGPEIWVELSSRQRCAPDGARPVSDAAHPLDGVEMVRAWFVEDTISASITGPATVYRIGAAITRR